MHSLINYYRGALVVEGYQARKEVMVKKECLVIMEQLAVLGAEVSLGRLVLGDDRDKGDFLGKKATQDDRDCQGK